MSVVVCGSAWLESVGGKVEGLLSRVPVGKAARMVPGNHVEVIVNVFVLVSPDGKPLGWVRQLAPSQICAASVARTWKDARHSESSMFDYLRMLQGVIAE